ncbi:MAG: aminoglycoside phosphotransferase family protein [Sphingomonas bacterium]
MDDAAATTVESLRRAGIAPAGEAVTLTPLSGGVSCDVWLARIGERPPIVVKRALPKLRVAADWRAPVERAENEVRWLRRAHGIDPRLAPLVVAEVPAEHLFALAWLEPEAHPVWRDELIAGRADPAFASGLGRDLARIHTATAGNAEDARAFDSMDLFDALRISPFLRHVAANRPEASARLTAIADDLQGRRTALVHGDVSPKNILCGPQGAVILDAECAVYGDPAFDLAFCATHLLLKTIWLAPHAAALKRSAAAMADTYLAGVAWEPAADLAARAGALVAALLLARVEGKSPAPYLDDAAKQMVRARALALLDASPAIDALIANWSTEH